MRTPLLLAFLCVGSLAARADDAFPLPLPNLARPVPDEVEPGEKEPASSTCRKKALPIVIDRVPFGPGEELNYDIAYFGIRTGKASLKMDDKSTVDATPIYPVRAQVKTDGFLEVLGNLDVRMVTFLDPRTMTPTRMVNRSVTRGGAFTKGTAVAREDGAFAALRNTPGGPVGGEVNARYERTAPEGNAKKRARLETDADVVDALSVVYYLRSRALKDGAPFCFELYHRRRLWRVEGKVAGTEAVSAPIGKRNARKLSATITRIGGDKKTAPPPRAVTAFISTDDDHVPVLVQTPEKVGTIEVRLVSHKRGRQLVSR
jgi:hypothetical protein